MIGRTNAGGGAGINFKVVGGTVQPTGKENLVWVNTSTAISSWAVSRNQPDNPIEGLVWIVDGSSNEINILRKNAIKLCPSGCKQYHNGAWNQTDSYIFTNGQWVQFTRQYLYSEGDEYTAVTGGWVLATDGYPSHGDTLEKNSDSMTFSTSAEQGLHYSLGFLHPKNMISLDKYKTLNVEFDSVENDADGCVIVTTTNKYNVLSSFDPDPAMAASSDIIRDGKGVVVSVDISSLTGSYYVGPAFGNSGTATLVIKHIWLE